MKVERLMVLTTVCESKTFIFMDTTGTYREGYSRLDPGVCESQTRTHGKSLGSVTWPCPGIADCLLAERVCSEHSRSCRD